VDKLQDGRLHLSQPQLIESILKDLGLDLPNATSGPTPALVAKSKTPHRDLKGVDYDETFDYRSVVAKMNCLEKSTRPEIP
jgi:hypothetical protein